MTIKEFVMKQKPMGINEWLQLISNKGLTKFESNILNCAEHFNLITINHNAEFINAIN